MFFMLDQFTTRPFISTTNAKVMLGVVKIKQWFILKYNSFPVQISLFIQINYLKFFIIVASHSVSVSALSK